VRAVSPVPQAPLTWFLETHDGLSVLVLGGTLDEVSAKVLYDGVTALLRRRRAGILIDVAALSVATTAGVASFTRIMAEAQRWPDVRVLVCAPSAVVKPHLSADVLDPRLLFADVAAGQAVARAPVPTIVEDLLPVAGAAQRARDLITEACLRWDEPALVGTAALVASELVTNAVVHAHTLMSMTVRLQLCHLHIAVVDGSAAHAVHRPLDRHSAGGRGMHLVDAVSLAWGSTSLPTGKVVWSVLERMNDHP
jgi:anti-anti-sigma regulatory factor